MTDYQQSGDTLMFKDFVKSPHDQAVATMDEINALQKNAGNRYDMRRAVPSMLHNDITSWGPQLILIQGRTGHAKSTVGDIIMQDILSDSGKNDIAVKVSYENTIQEDGIKLVAANLGIQANMILDGKLNELHMKKANESVKQVAQSKLWWVGPDAKSAQHFRMPKISEVMRLLYELREVQKKNIRMILIDHFHRVPIEKFGNSDVGSLNSTIDALNAMSFAFNCPLVVLAQSNRESVKDKSFKLPPLSGLKGTGKLEEDARFVLSLWMPARSPDRYSIGDTVKVGHGSYLVTDNLLVMGVMKQKFNAYPVITANYIDFERLKLNHAQPSVDPEDAGISHD